MVNGAEVISAAKLGPRLLRAARMIYGNSSFPHAPARDGEPVRVFRRGRGGVYCTGRGFAALNHGRGSTGLPDFLISK
jgi:hypothetical protein